MHATHHPFRSLAFLLAVAGLVLAPAGLKGQSTSKLWQEYQAAPDTSPNLPNCSYAGYGYGEKPLPKIDGPVYNVRDYGAKGDGETDDFKSIRAALAAVGDKGGVVYFPKGKYVVSDVLFVHTDRTVLRGEDRDQSEIIFTQPLLRAYGRSDLGREQPEAQWFEGEKHASNYSWSGGLIWFTPKSKNTYRANKSPFSFTTSWEVGKGAMEIAKPATRGMRTVVLAGTAKAKPGDFVLIEMADPGDFSMVKHIAGGGAWADAYDWLHAPQNASWPKPKEFQWVAEVTSVNGNEVTFRQPLRFDIRQEWKPRLFALGDTIRESGIENLTVRMMRDYTYTSAQHHFEHGWNGPWFNLAINCWLRDVTVVNPDLGTGVSSSKCVTLTGFTIKADSSKLMAHHYGTTCKMSYDCLFSDFKLESQSRHGVNSEGFASGNVWTRGVMAHGTFDMHRKMTYESMWSDIVICNDGTHGGSGGPLMGARCVHWNIKVTGGHGSVVGWANAMPMGAVVGLQGTEVDWNAQNNRMPVGEISGARVESKGKVPNPANLYEAQLKLRLGTQ